MQDQENLRISLAGAQEKTALLFQDGQWMRPHGATPSTHILKLPLGLVGHRLADFSSSVENEWLCMNLLAEFGLPVAKTEILQFGSQKVLSVARFDRQLHSSGNWLMRLPQEDFCQVKGLSSHLKYEADGGPSVADLAAVLQGSIQAKQDLTTLLTTQLLFWMLAAPDGHAKNFSLRILPQGRSKCFQRVDAEDVIRTVLARVPTAIDAVAGRLPPGFPEWIAQSIFEGLLGSATLLERMPKT